MKSIITLFFLLPIFFVNGQTCSINYSLTVPGADPANLPNGQIGVPFAQDMTLLFPQQDGSGTNYTTFSIKSVELPLGLTWEWSQDGSATPFDPQTDPYTCMKIHGTPAEAGNFIVKITASGMLSGGSASDYIFESTLIIDSSSVSNALFSMSPALACETANIQFKAINMSNYIPVAGLTNGITHQWDFGNGNQSTDAIPVVQNYSSVGEFPVTYTRIFDTIGFKLQSIKITSVGATDAVGYGNPDLYVQLMDASNAVVYNTESSPNDGDLPQTYTMNLLLDNPPYTIRIMDDDSDNLWGTDDDNAIDNNENTNTVAFDLPGINSYGLTTLSGGSGSLTFTYNIQKDTTHLIAHDTVIVYSNPATPIITTNPGTPLTLSTTDLGYVYHWFLDGTRLYNKKGTTIDPDGSGDYTVMVVDDHGCSASSTTQNIDVSAVKDFNDFTFAIFPNPANSNVSIQLGNSIDKGTITIADLTGRVVNSTSITKNNFIQISTANLANGIYSISIKNDLGNLKTTKLVVQH